MTLALCAAASILAAVSIGAVLHERRERKRSESREELDLMLARHGIRTIEGTFRRVEGQ